MLNSMMVDVDFSFFFISLSLSLSPLPFRPSIASYAVTAILWGCIALSSSQDSPSVSSIIASTSLLLGTVAKSDDSNLLSKSKKQLVKLWTSHPDLVEISITTLLKGQHSPSVLPYFDALGSFTQHKESLNTVWSSHRVSCQEVMVLG